MPTNTNNTNTLPTQEVAQLHSCIADMRNEIAEMKDKMALKNHFLDLGELKIAELESKLFIAKDENVTKDVLLGNAEYEISSLKGVIDAVTTQD